MRHKNLASSPKPQSDPVPINPAPNKSALPLPLPELRPRIRDVRFAHLISVKAIGLETAHEGETAYEVLNSRCEAGKLLLLLRVALSFRDLRAAQLQNGECS